MLRTTVLRRLGRSPAFTVIAVLTLALGIGANAAIFSVVYGVLLRPLPYPGSERLVAVSHDAPGLELYDFDSSQATYSTYRNFSSALEESALVSPGTVNLTGVDRPQRIDSAEVTPGFFATLGVAMARGPGFEEKDGLPEAEPVVVVSHALWQTRLGGDPEAIGRRLRVDGVERRVVGVAPAGFDHPAPETAVWLPLVFDPAAPNDGNFNWRSVARLAPGVGVESARAELSGLLPRMAEEYGDNLSAGMIRDSGMTTLVKPLRDEVVGDVGNVLWVLLGTVGMILLIACANVANLFLVRAEGRQREMAVRTALGAGRGQLATGFLAESVALGLAGGVVGLGMAFAGVKALVAFGPETIPRLHEVGVGPMVLAFTVLLSLFAGLLFGCVPLLRFNRGFSLVSALKEGGRGSTTGRERHLARNSLVAAQVALAVVLLAGSGLMLRSFWSLRAVDPGFEPDGLLTLRVSLDESDYADGAQVADFFRRVQERIAVLPGVSAVGAGTGIPLEGFRSMSGHFVEDFPIQPGELPDLLPNLRVTPGYFEALEIPLLAGRTYDPSDPQRMSGDAVVSRALVERYWPGRPPTEALGKRFQLGVPSEGEERPWSTIAGVVGDVHFDGLTEDPPELIYYVNGPLPEGMNGWFARTLTVTVRTSGPPLGLADGVREAIWAEDPNLPIANVRTARDVVDRSMARTSFTMVLLVIAAAVALVLGSVGLYGVISYLVSLRTQEIGVRMALGAAAGDVARMVVRQGLTVAGIGVAIGIAGAFAATRLMKALLFGVAPTDLPTFGAVVTTLLLVAAAASWFPARRAAAIDPLRALRHE
ncbi:MAG TPA: ABC transporter permease [Thermoanaerobaculia bacterium]|nr:ABC transporter permease [Thermoanaerobaculia bacterium]